MHVFLTIAGLDPEYGGPSRSVPALAEALARDGAKVELITCEPAASRPAPRLPDARLVSTRVLPFADRATRWAARHNGFFSALQERCRATPDSVIHDNGLWLPGNHAAAAAARELNRPLLISPRGMLSGWARAHKGWKKKMAWWLYQRRDLLSAAVLHATSLAEAVEFRNVGLSQPIAIIPNGVELLPGNRKSEIGNPKLEIRTALFLGRIHPVKGLLDLVHAWAKVSSQWSEVSGQSNWRVVIAGRGEAGHVEEVKVEIRKLKLETSFEFVGPVEGDAKWSLYHSADLFVLPSHSENFGIVVAEALACGVPVITTKGAPWECLQTHRCGWWTDIGVAPLAAVLRDAMSRTDAERQEMGQRGRAWMERDFSWAGVAAKMKTVYAWMLGQGPTPDCVV